jgi:hypothetical protein
MQTVESSVDTARVADGRVARLAKYQVSATLLGILLVVVGLATAWNLEGFPGRVDDDEGTYVSQAWAIIDMHTLTHYSYWYDHPPLGWIQIAAFAWITDGFNRVADAVYVGREFMWCLTLVGCVLVYVLCRRLGLRQATSAVAVLLFGLSPIAQYFHRMVSLDNIETIWVLAALVAATSTKAVAVWGPGLRTGICTAFAVLSKETAIIFLPVIVWVLWQHRGKLRVAAQKSRAAQFWVFAIALCVIVVLYPLYALQRNQLPLWWSTLKWQFFDRPGSGSLLDSSSTTYSMVHQWVSTDPWLLLGGFAAALLTGFSRRLRPFGCALLLQVVVLIHGGYLPFFYVTAVVPFAAVCIAGTADALWTKADLSRVLRGSAAAIGGRAGRYAPYLGRVVVALAALTFVGYVLPQWVSYLTTNSAVGGNVPYLEAAAWAERNVPKSDVVVVDDYLWVDLKTHGLDPLWMWKINSSTAPGWQSINYIIIQQQSPATLASMPSLQGAYEHSVLVKNFGGGLTVRRVIDAGSSARSAPALTIQHQLSSIVRLSVTI